MSVTDLFHSMEYGPAPEGAEVAVEWLERHGRRFGHFIGGEMLPAAPEALFETFDPATGRVLAHLSTAGQAEVDAAVEAADRALPEWNQMGGDARARFLYAIARQIQKHARLFAVLESIDNGKPIRETRDIDVPLVARHFYHHAGWASMIDECLPGSSPVGVCGQIIPWNFPLLMLAWKIAPALAAGNTVVLKPAEFTSLTALLFGEICQTVGLPQGVVNIVTGDGSTGALIVAHPKVRKVAFTGSTDVGRILRQQTAGSGKKLSLELGGKSPFIVFEDADLDSAVEGLVDAIWFNQGQVCCAGSRLLVQESVSDRVLDKVRARMAKLRIGSPLDKAVDLGAIVAPVQLERIRMLVEQSQAEGASLFQPSCAFPEGGWFYPPTLLTGVSPASTAAQVEIFGPVLVAMTFRTPKEAVELANNTPYGLAASIWSESVNLALDVADKVKAGTVWVNCTNRFDAASGFGGYRESGFGREGGLEGLLEYRAEASEPMPGPPATRSKGEMPPASGIDRTHKQFIGGKQARPDSGYSLTIDTALGTVEVARGNRKDVRNAVESARSAQPKWAETDAHLRSQILYYIAENMASSRAALEASVAATDPDVNAGLEVDAAVTCLFRIAGKADKIEGSVHSVPMRGLVYTRVEPIGVVGVVCPDERPLLTLVALVGAAIAAGNAVVALASERHPLPMTEWYRILEASDVPAGVVNLLTGLQGEMDGTLADHDDLDGLWHFGTLEAAGDAELRSSGNLKRTWTRAVETPGWFRQGLPAMEPLLRRATQVKNVWVPFGE
jgi:aldehyde dehydrogenase (NAD+)